MSFEDGNVVQKEKVTTHACSKQSSEVCLFMIFDGVSVNMREGVSSLCVGEMVCYCEYYIFNSEYSGLLTKIYFLTCDIIFLLCRPRPSPCNSTGSLGQCSGHEPAAAHCSQLLT